jgi:hypothetical protein
MVREASRGSLRSFAALRMTSKPQYGWRYEKAADCDVGIGILDNGGMFVATVHAGAD